MLLFFPKVLKFMEHLKFLKYIGLFKFKLKRGLKKPFKILKSKLTESELIEN